LLLLLPSLSLPPSLLLLPVSLLLLLLLPVSLLLLLLLLLLLVSLLLLLLPVSLLLLLLLLPPAAGQIMFSRYKLSSRYTTAAGSRGTETGVRTAQQGIRGKGRGSSCSAIFERSQS